jgi:hypothetical protein
MMTPIVRDMDPEMGGASEGDSELLGCYRAFVVLSWLE